jgi:phage host-nuclease inhibitor protein Gam
MTTLSFPGTSPTIRNRDQLNAVVENIILLRAEQAGLDRAQADEIAAIREKYRAPLTEVDRYLQMETAWVETWARQNPDEFSAERLIDCPHARIGYRETPPRVERASRRWTWTEASIALAATAWGSRYLRTPEPEIDKETILADLATLPVEDLHEVGIKIVQGERFYIEAHGQPEESSASGENWQEAA